MLSTYLRQHLEVFWSHIHCCHWVSHQCFSSASFWYECAMSVILVLVSSRSFFSLSSVNFWFLCFRQLCWRWDSWWFLTFFRGLFLDEWNPSLLVAGWFPAKVVDASFGMRRAFALNRNTVGDLSLEFNRGVSSHECRIHFELQFFSYSHLVVYEAVIFLG